MMCAPDPWFETHEECMTSELGCLGATTMYWDNECGEATRAKYQCTADATTCDEYDARTDIWADDWPCKPQSDRLWELKCGQQDPP